MKIEIKKQTKDDEEMFDPGIPIQVSPPNGPGWSWGDIKTRLADDGISDLARETVVLEDVKIRGGERVVRKSVAVDIYPALKPEAKIRVVEDGVPYITQKDLEQFGRAERARKYFEKRSVLYQTEGKQRVLPTLDVTLAVLQRLYEGREDNPDYVQILRQYVGLGGVFLQDTEVREGKVYHGERQIGDYTFTRNGLVTSDFGETFSNPDFRRLTGFEDQEFLKDLADCLDTELMLLLPKNQVNRRTDSEPHVLSCYVGFSADRFILAMTHPEVIGADKIHARGMAVLD